MCVRRRDQKRTTKKPNSGKLGIRRDHPRRRIELKFCAWGSLQMVVLRIEFHRNRYGGFGAVGVGRNVPVPIDLVIGLYTACTTEQL